MKKVFNENKIVLMDVKINHPHLREPWGYNDSPKKYSAQIIIDKDDTDNLNKVNKAIDSAIEKANFIYDEKIPDSNALSLPLKDSDEKYGYEPMYYNSYYMTATSTIMPEIVDHNKKVNYGLNDIVSGQYVNISMSFYAFKAGDGKKVVACRLHNVQMLPKKFDPTEYYPKATDDFEIVSDNESYSAENTDNKE